MSVAVDVRPLSFDLEDHMAPDLVMNTSIKAGTEIALICLKISGVLTYLY